MRIEQLIKITLQFGFSITLILISAPGLGDSKMKGHSVGLTYSTNGQSDHSKTLFGSASLSADWTTSLSVSQQSLKFDSGTSGKAESIQGALSYQGFRDFAFSMSAGSDKWDDNIRSQQYNLTGSLIYEDWIFELAVGNEKTQLDGLPKLLFENGESEFDSPHIDLYIDRLLTDQMVIFFSAFRQWNQIHMTDFLEGARVNFIPESILSYLSSLPSSGISGGLNYDWSRWATGFSVERSTTDYQSIKNKTLALKLDYRFSEGLKLKTKWSRTLANEESSGSSSASNFYQVTLSYSW